MKDLNIKQRAVFWGYAFALWVVFLLLFILRVLFYKLPSETGTVEELEIEIQSYQSGSWLWFLLLTGALLALLYVGWDKILHPLLEIRKRLALFQEGIIYDEMFESIKGISSLLDGVAGKLQRTLDKNKMIENSRQQAKYLALQNQINPHFLYNVLESIRSDALIAGMPEIGQTAEALAMFFRYTISNMDNLSTIQDEINNVESYFLIQKYRFGEKIALKVNYDEQEPEIMNAAIPKLTLQPIVENAIRHGIEPKVEGGIIRIFVERSRRNLFVTISDDGLGMSPERLKEVNSRLDVIDYGGFATQNGERGGIALLNVNSRIRLLMGEEYGLHVFSTEDVGTEVKISLPYMERKG